MKEPSPSGDGFQFIFPRGRNPGSSLGLTVFWLIWSGIVVLILHLQAPLLFPIAFGIADVVILAIAVDLWFFRSVVDVSPRGVTVTAGRFGPGRSQWIEAADVAKIAPVQGMQSGQTVYYNIVITSRGGKKITAGKRVASHRLATAVIGQIQQALAGR